MSDNENAFGGIEYSEAEAEISIERDELKEAGGRGFSNPEVLARAQETRRKNKEANAAVDAPNESTPGAKRGRKPAAPKTKRDLSGIVVPLVGIHFMLAQMSGLPDLAIDEGEATTIASALSNLTEYYKVKIDGKQGAILGLIYALAVVYGPRIYTITRAIREEREKNNVRS